MHNFVIVIPARLNSTRLPNKPLINICGLPMIIRTCKQCNKVVNKSKIFVATDNKKIANLVSSFGYQYVLTSKKCKTGTDRLNEVSKKIKSKIYINVQGDEPILNPSDLKKIINASLKNETYPIIGYTNLIDKKQFYSPNIPKIVFDKNNFLMYISRSPIPLGKIKKNIEFYKQICIYSFPKNVLHYYGPNKKKSNLENIEDIEIIRLIENSIPVKVLKLSNLSMAVDTKSDLRKVIKLLSNN